MKWNRDPDCQCQWEQGEIQSWLTSGERMSSCKRYDLQRNWSWVLSPHVETSIFQGWCLSEKTVSWKKANQTVSWGILLWGCRVWGGPSCFWLWVSYACVPSVSSCLGDKNRWPEGRGWTWANVMLTKPFAGDSLSWETGTLSHSNPPEFSQIKKKVSFFMGFFFL